MDPDYQDDAFVERALRTSLFLSLALASLDLLLYLSLGTAIVTVLVKGYSLWIYVRYRLRIDGLKLLEIGALVADVFLVLEHGLAVFSPIATLLSIILVSSFKERFLIRYRQDLARVFSDPKP